MEHTPQQKRKTKVLSIINLHEGYTKLFLDQKKLIKSINGDWTVKDTILLLSPELPLHKTNPFIKGNLTKLKLGDKITIKKNKSFVINNDDELKYDLKTNVAHLSIVHSDRKEYSNYNHFEYLVINEDTIVLFYDGVGNIEYQWWLEKIKR
jgi:hypothetical protein